MFPWLPWPSKNRATPGVATATPRPIGFLAAVGAAVPNLSTGRTAEKASGKSWLWSKERQITMGTFIHHKHTASHFPLG